MIDNHLDTNDTNRSLAVPSLQFMFDDVLRFSSKKVRSESEVERKGTGAKRCKSGAVAGHVMPKEARTYSDG